jgi:hypothetical protein
MAPGGLRGIFKIVWVFAGIVTGSHQTNKLSVSSLGNFLCGLDGVVGRGRGFGRVVEIRNFGVTGYPPLVQAGGGALRAFSAAGGTNSLVSVDAMQEFRRSAVFPGIFHTAPPSSLLRCHFR